MNLGMIGLGKMGANMVRRLARNGHHVAAYDLLPGLAETLAQEETGVFATKSLEHLAAQLEPARVLWMMVPAGEPTEAVCTALLDILEPGDIVVDGGNANYKDTMRRASTASDKRLHYVDVGISGGIWGLREGYSMMIGGEKDVVERLRPAFETLAPGMDRGWDYVGPSGAGHFVKMVHNGIEYALMQAYAEGLAILRAKEEFAFNLHRITEIWRYGSVVRSWLLDLTSAALAEDQDLSAIEGWVADTGEGRWTVFEAIDQDVPAPVITLSLLMRLVSRQEDSYAAKVLAVMRKQFGGHAVKRSD